MIPPYYKKLDEMPHTPDGKIDRMSLKKLEDSNKKQVNYVAPRNDLERKIAEVWQEVLKVDRIGIDDDIFGLGGNSLLAMRLELAMEMNDLEMEGVDIFQYRTIRKLAEQIEINQKDNGEGDDKETENITNPIRVEEEHANAEGILENKEYTP
jgi:acyl carrier protein